MASRHEIVTEIVQLLNGSADLHTIRVGQSEIDVRRNDDFDVEAARQFPDGFLYFPCFLDIVALPAQDEQSQIELIGLLLRNYWAKGVPSIAACDFETRLPEGGGYRSRAVPWEPISGRS